MGFTDIAVQFQKLRKARRVAPETALAETGNLALACLELLGTECVLELIEFKGTGEKKYVVAALAGATAQFSRPLRQDLFITDPAAFSEVWGNFRSRLIESKGSMRLSGISGDDCVRACYTAVMSYAACIDIHRPGDRGSPGVFLEMVIGPSVALLLDTIEAGAVSVAIEETGASEKIPTDLTFPKDGLVTLVVPTKISTRERISQAFVHQLILNSACPGQYRTALVCVNETNVMVPPDTLPTDRVASVSWVRETLVPNTIALYEKYVAAVAGMYYLDPPIRYVNGDCKGLPPVKRLDALLLEDLAALTSID